MAVACLAGLLALPSPVWSQSTQPSDGLLTPRNNVKGGSLASRRPGLWTQAGKATHIERQQKALKQFGGAEYEGPEQYPDSKGQVFLVSFFESLFDILNDVVEELSLLLQAAQVIEPVS